jgi:hypothetical protein
MTTQRFNPEEDFAPMPFDKQICLKALEMKNSGLVWRPHVGCFVWDPDEIIKPDSPFPNRIYFILSLKRFIDIFKTIDRIADKLVWLPTHNQALDLYRLLNGTGGVKTRREPEGPELSEVEKLLYIYGLIIDALKEKITRSYLK